MQTLLKSIQLINSRTVFISTLIIIPTLILIVYLTGIQEHRSLYLNSLISTTILSVVLISFLTIGLYNGWKLKDTLGKFYLKYQPPKKTDFPDFDLGGFNLGDVGDDGIAGILTAILLWLVIAVFGSIILYYVGGIFWLTVLTITGILYWIVFRAFRLIFKNSGKCRGNLASSFFVALGYTLMYNFWIYGIIILAHFLERL
jgi:hypothetical protein